MSQIFHGSPFEIPQIWQSHSFLPISCDFHRPTLYSLYPSAALPPSLLKTSLLVIPIPRQGPSMSYEANLYVSDTCQHIHAFLRTSVCTVLLSRRYGMNTCLLRRLLHAIQHAVNRSFHKNFMKRN